MKRKDREWMYNRHDGRMISSTFLKKVDEFIDCVIKKDGVMMDGLIKCPCPKCKNLPWRDPETAKEHLYRRGFVPSYYDWICHGEDEEDELSVENVAPSLGSSSKYMSNSYSCRGLDAVGPPYNGHKSDKIDNGEEEPLPELKAFLEMLEESEKPLCKGCRMSVLSVAAQVKNVKCEYNMAHRGMDSRGHENVKREPRGVKVYSKRHENEEKTFLDELLEEARGNHQNLSPKRLSKSEMQKDTRDDESFRIRTMYDLDSDARTYYEKPSISRWKKKRARSGYEKVSEGVVASLKKTFREQNEQLKQLKKQVESLSQYVQKQTGQVIPPPWNPPPPPDAGCA